MMYTTVTGTVVAEHPVSAAPCTDQSPAEPAQKSKYVGIRKYSRAEQIAYKIFTGLSYILPLGSTFYCIATGWPASWLQPFVLFASTVALIGINMSVCLHRYFAHRAFETSRAFQFVLAVMGCLAYQNGPLWWASKHNRHHKYCDLVDDPHSVTQTGFFYAYVGWTMVIEESHVDESFLSPQFRNKPELQFLNTFWPLPSMVLCGLLYAITQDYFWTGTLYITPMLLCRLITLLFNVEYHPAQDPKKCKAVDTPRFLAIIVGEADHLDHHKNPMRLQRPGWDLPYYFFVKPCKALGLIWDRKSS